MKQLLPKLISLLLFVFSIQWVSPTPAYAATWAAEQNLSNSSAKSVYAAIKADPSGNIHVAWLEYGAGASIVEYSNNVSGSFLSSPFQVATNGGAGAEPLVALTISNGKVHIFYTDKDGELQHVLLNVTGGAPVKETTSVVSQPGEKSVVPSAITDSNQRVHVVWTSNASGQYQLYHRIWSNGSWEGSNRGVDLNGQYQNHPSLAANASGVYLTYRNDRAFAYATFNGTTWSPGPVPAIATNVNQTALVLKGNTLYTVFSSSAGSTHEVFYSRLDGGSWSAPTKVSKANVYADQPSILYNPSTDSVFTMWQDGNDASTRVIATREVKADNSLGEVETVGVGGSQWPRGAGGATSPFITFQNRPSGAGNEEIKLAAAVLQAATTPTPMPADGTWVPDAEVTYVGKSAARSDAFINWALSNYNWLCVTKEPTGNCNNDNNPLIPFWQRILTIMYAFLAPFVLLSAFILMVTRGKSITLKRFIPRFIFIALFMTFSFSAIQIIYQVADIIQSFFLHNPDKSLISSKDLLYIGFNYTDFVGFRLVGAANEESAAITLILTKLTAITYYMMTGMLIIRKIILWFFIVLSPIFPFLILYAPVRNTGKIWIGEFFRWVMYGPLFSVLLAGLVSMWKIGIPLPFSFGSIGVGDPEKNIYPTAVNILLGGPGQVIGINNSINLPETFAQYVIALIMLWIVTLLPFLLLQIFLDHLMSLSLQDNALVQQLLQRTLRPVPPPTPVGSPSPGSVGGAGLARTLPLSNKYNLQTTTTSASSEYKTGQYSSLFDQSSASRNTQANNEVLRLANLSTPTMRDIARYEITKRSTKTVTPSSSDQMSMMHDTLVKIANPSNIQSVNEREHFSQIHDKLVKETLQKNSVATSILTAANHIAQARTASSPYASAGVREVLGHIANPGAAPVPSQSTFITLRDTLQTEKDKGSVLAASILSAAKINAGELEVDNLRNQLLSAKEKNDPLANTLLSLIATITKQKELASSPAPAFPVVNRVQSVSLDDYEAVKKMWAENYQQSDVPTTVPNSDRSEWVRQDIEEMNKTISLLVAADQQKNKEGMDSVSAILPFLLIGGFSQTEIVAYLKAKIEAAKSVLSILEGQQENEDTLMDKKKDKKEEPKAMTMEAEANPDPSAQSAQNQTLPENPIFSSPSEEKKEF